MTNAVLWQAAAYFLIVALPFYPLYCTGQVLWVQMVKREQGNPDTAALANRTLFPALVGVVERPLFLAALMGYHAEFIGVWLALKVAGGWFGWTEGIDVPAATGTKTVRVPGRVLFNRNLILSGLSVAYALAFSEALSALPHDGWLALLIATSPFLLDLTIALIAGCWHHTPTPQPPTQQS